MASRCNCPLMSKERSWWLQQLVALTPVEFWQQTLDKVLSSFGRSRRSDWKTALRQGWLRALDTA